MTARSFSGRLSAGSGVHKVDLHLHGERLEGTIDGKRVEAEVAAGGASEVVLRVGGRRVVAFVARADGKTLVAIDGRVVAVSRADAHADHVEGAASSDPFAVSPMAGVLVKVHVKPGDSVTKGAPLFAVEAMKMEYVVKADRPVTIAEIKRAPGTRVTLGEVLVTFREATA